MKTKSLEEQIVFYQNILGLKSVESSAKSATFQFGYTKVEFVEFPDATPYHFAVNIPVNKAIEALSWMQARTEILKDGDQALIDFNSWNALSLYFYDRNHNVVELIERKNLDIGSDGPFGPSHFLGISEIGMPVENIEETWHRINRIRPVPVFDGNFENFCAMGDEHGLLIVVDKHRKTWYPTNDAVFPSSFRLEGDFQFEFLNGEIRN